MGLFKNFSSDVIGGMLGIARLYQTREFLISKGVIRGYDAARKNRLTNDWKTDNQQPFKEAKSDLPELRRRSRDAVKNNGHIRKYAGPQGLLGTNVIGDKGIQLQSKATKSDGKLDKELNRTVEQAFKIWSRRENCLVSKDMSFQAAQVLVLTTTAVDGEIFIRKVRYKNQFGFALQLLEGDFIPEWMIQDLQNGNRIRNGIEFDRFGARVAYYISGKDRLDNSYFYRGQNFIRVPAEEILHVFVKESPSQTRGFPWTAAALIKLRHLDKYDESKLVNSRVSASQMAVITNNGEGKYTGEGETEQGDVINEISPGLMLNLDKGKDVKMLTPVADGTEYAAYVKSSLRSASVSLGPSYNSLASDLEGVNFSSLRQGALSERDFYKMLQAFIAEAFPDQFFHSWLVSAFMNQQLEGVKATDIERLRYPIWRARRWPWVDPVKDLTAGKLAVELGVKSHSDIANEGGEDYEDVQERLSQERAERENVVGDNQEEVEA